MGWSIRLFDVAGTAVIARTCVGKQLIFVGHEPIVTEALQLGAHANSRASARSLRRRSGGRSDQERRRQSLAAIQEQLGVIGRADRLASN